MRNKMTPKCIYQFHTHAMIPSTENMWKKIWRPFNQQTTENINPIIKNNLIKLVYFKKTVSLMKLF